MEEYIKEHFYNLGNKIKFLREDLGLSIKDLSIKTGIKEQYLKKIEKGIAFGISISHINNIADALGIKLTELLKGI